MWLGDVVDEWRTRGFVILPEFLSAAELAPALRELPTMFPTPEGFHDGTDARRARYVDDEFDGIDAFPFASTAFSLLAVHPRLPMKPNFYPRTGHPYLPPRHRTADASRGAVLDAAHLPTG